MINSRLGRRLPRMRDRCPALGSSGRARGGDRRGRRCAAPGSRARHRPGRFGGAESDGIRHAAAGHGADAEQGSARRNKHRFALGAAGARRVLVRPETPGLVFGAGRARALGRRHFGDGQRRQYGEIVRLARCSVRRRLSRAHHAVADFSGLHRGGIEHGGRRRLDAGRPRPLRGPAGGRRASAAKSPDYRNRRARLQSRRRQRRRREINRRDPRANSRSVVRS